MPRVEIEQVALLERDPATLLGRHIDLPKLDSISEASALNLMGWVLPRSGPAVAIEILQDEKVTERVPLNHERPDIAQAFPHVEDAQHSGFRSTVSALGAGEHFELTLRAVLRDQSRVPI